MKNEDKPSMPVCYEMDEALDGHQPKIYRSGLTKREHFAGLAMQGCAAAFKRCILGGDFNTIAITSCQMADALLAELEKSND